MLISELLPTQLYEAKYKKPIVMYHGTSSKFLQSILSAGMAVDPNTKTWADDPDASIHSPSRASLGGSYWTSSLLTATSSAGRTVRKFGGNRLLIIANIATQSALADEDNITGVVNRAFSAVIRRMFGIAPDAVAAWIGFWYDSNLRGQFLQQFSTELHGALTGNSAKPVNNELMEYVVGRYIDRMLAHTGEGAFKRLREKPDVTIPSIADAERGYLSARDRLTRYYRESAEDRDSFSHTLRYPSTVGFSGSSKITHILELGDGDVVTMRYGSRSTLPAQLLSDWRSSIGAIKFVDE